MKNGIGLKDNMVNEFRLPLEKGEVGRFGQFSLPWPSRNSYSYRILQQRSLKCEDRGIFPNTVHHYGLFSGFPYYGLTTQACRMPGVPQSTTWDTQPSYSELFLVAFYDKLSAAASLFF